MGASGPTGCAGTFGPSHCKIRRRWNELFRTCSAVLLIAIVGCGTARGEDEPKDDGIVKTGTKFAAGALVGLAAHETGHVILDAAFGADPHLKKVEFGGIPFFAIAHDPVSPHREFAISSAGFWVQHATDEWLLSDRGPIGRAHRPGCRGVESRDCRPGAFVNGVFAFNVLTSVGYAMAAFADFGPYERDTRSMAASSHVSEPLIGASILAPALLDAYRYYHPQSKTAKWVSRAVKIGGALLILR